MRRNKREESACEFKMMTLDDDLIMTATLQSYFSRGGYHVDVENDPVAAIETIRNGSYDILMLDYMMTPLTGDQVVEKIREFNKDIFIILLTGHREMVPPVVTIRSLDIQGYFEKSDRYDQLEMLVESCAKSIRQMRTIKKYRNQLTDMSNSMPRIQNSCCPEDLVNNIAAVSSELWEAEGVFVSVKTPDSEAGIFTSAVGNELAFDKNASPEQLVASLSPEEYLSSVITDNEGAVCGVIVVKTAGADDYYEKQRFNIFVRQCISATDNVFLMNKVSTGYSDLIQAIRLLVDAKDGKTRGHSDRVSMLAAKMAEKEGLSKETVDKVRLAGLFHDVGKIAVPDSILKSSSRLTNEEYNEIKKHPAAGYNILRAIPSFAGVAPIVRAHHERVDGRGYPDGLTGDSMTIEAKIIAAADCYDAMASNRIYAAAKSLTEVHDEMVRIKGTQLDAHAVDLLLEILKDEGDNFTRDISDESIRPEN